MASKVILQRFNVKNILLGFNTYQIKKADILQRALQPRFPGEAADAAAAATTALQFSSTDQLHL